MLYYSKRCFVALPSFLQQSSSNAPLTENDKKIKSLKKVSLPCFFSCYFTRTLYIPSLNLILLILFL